MNKLSLNQMERVSGGLSWGCGFAIGGDSLAVFLIGKGLGVGGLVTSCGNNGVL